LPPAHYRKRRRRYRIHYGRIFLALFTFAALLTGVISLSAFFLRGDFIEPDFPTSAPVVTPVAAQIAGSTCYADSVRARRMEASVGEIYSRRALLIELETGRILYRKEPAQPDYPASLTKMMTILLAIENLPDPDVKVTLPAEIFPSLYQMNASMAGFQPGDTPTVRELLYGTMLPSGAECAIALGRAVAGADEAFVAMMNARAAELGMSRTQFKNCTGLHEEGHVSTAEDMACLLTYALRLPAFRELFTTAEYTTSPTSYYPAGIQLRSTMFRQLSTPSLCEGRGELLGGKTGYTGEAGQCLASLAVIDGREYILITLGAGDGSLAEPWHILDAQHIYGEISDYWA